MASKARITTDESRARFSPRAALVAGGAAALAVTALWVALTAATGKTYHLAPPVIAWLPGLAVSLARRNSPGSAPPRGGLSPGLRASALGVAIVIAGWVTISVAGITPSATVFHGQPGGVPGEVAATTLVGALLGTRRVARAR
jgi:hypothetical protein